MKAGILEEMIEDTMETLEVGEEEETEVQDQIDKILLELTAGALGKAPDALTGMMGGHSDFYIHLWRIGKIATYLP